MTALISRWRAEVDAYMSSEEITRTELARRMGVSKSRVSQILNGTSTLNLKTITKVNDALGLDTNLSIGTEA